MKQQISKASSPWKRVGENLFRYQPSGTIYAVFRIKGKRSPKRISLETKDLVTAKGLLPGKIQETLDSEGPTSERVPLKAMAERYKKTLEGKSDNTKQARIAVIDRFASEITTVYIRDIKPSEVEGWLQSQMTKRNIKKTTYNEYLRVLKHFFDLAILDRAIKKSPVSHIKQARRDTPIRSVPTDEELQLILADIRSNKLNREAQESADFIEFEALAGVGNSETAALKWRDVDFQNNEITLYRNKTDTGFRIPIFPKLKEFLARKWSECDQNPTDKVFKISNPRKALDNSCKRMELQHFTNRSMRRYFISRAIRKGVDVKAVSKWQGHKDGGALILSTYSHILGEHEKEMAQKLS